MQRKVPSVDLKQYSTLLFDLDGTLLHARPRTVDLLNERVAEIWPGIEKRRLLKGERWWHYYWMPSEEMKRDVNTFGNTTSSDFWNNFISCYFDILDIDQIDRDIHLQNSQELAQQNQPSEHLEAGVEDLLVVLKNQGYRLGLFTNRYRPVEDMLDNLGIGKLFELVISGGELGIWKPDPKAFLAVLDIMKLQPSETIYIGDNYFADILGANAAGLPTMLVDPKGLFPEAECPVISSVVDMRDWFQ